MLTSSSPQAASSLLFLSDDAAIAAEYAGAVSRTEAAALPPAARALWSALGGSSPLFRGAADGAGSVAAVVREARGSQFDALLHALDKGARLPPSAACAAISGRDFHGNRNRPWAVHEGNLHLTVYYRAEVPMASVGFGLTMLPAVAVLDLLEPWANAPRQFGIKWVNDILWAGRKIGGVLTATRSEGGQLDDVVFGIGLNVLAAPVVPPTPFVPATGALADALPGRKLAVRKVFWPLVNVIEARFRELLAEGPDPLLDAYRRHSVCLGRLAQFWTAGTSDWRETPPIAAGRVIAIQPDLSLRLDRPPFTVAGGRLALDSLE